MLIFWGFDYFDLLYPFSRMTKFSQQSLLTFISHAPSSQEIPNLSLHSIHAMIPRWTATKYHTAPIQEVLLDIREKIITRSSGVHVYHSNLNPRNSKSPDDPYILLIFGEQNVFLDINRRRSFKYTHNKEEPSDVPCGNL